jgi:2-keto-4-pentenoate hydratase
MPMTDAHARARALYDALRTRMPIPPFTDFDLTLAKADGCLAQCGLIDLLLADGDRIVADKVGLTSEPMQRMIHVDSPEFNRLGPVRAAA